MFSGKISPISFVVDKLDEMVLSSSPIPLQNEVQLEYRSDLVVPIFTTYDSEFFSSFPYCTDVKDCRPMQAFQIPNKLPNVPIIKSPFYCCSVCLHPLSLLIPKVHGNVNETNQLTSEAKFQFYISKNVSHLVTQHSSISKYKKRKFKWQILLRFIAIDPSKGLSNLDKGIEELLPLSLVVHVNGEQQPILDFMDNTTNQKDLRYPGPVNITDNLTFNMKSVHGFRQNFSISWFQTLDVFRYYYVGVYLERKLSVDELLSTIVTDNQMHSLLSYLSKKSFSKSTKREFLHSDLDCESNTTVSPLFTVRLICPISNSRISIPLRTKYCKHFQCFDAVSFLSMNEYMRGWKCLLCGENATPKDLFIDNYFLTILNTYEASADVTEVSIRLDGSFISAKNCEVVDLMSDSESSCVVINCESPSPVEQHSKSNTHAGLKNSSNKTPKQRRALFESDIFPKIRSENKQKSVQKIENDLGSTDRNLDLDFDLANDVEKNLSEKSEETISCEDDIPLYTRLRNSCNSSRKRSSKNTPDCQISQVDIRNSMGDSYTLQVQSTWNDYIITKFLLDRSPFVQGLLKSKSSNDSYLKPELLQQFEEKSCESYIFHSMSFVPLFDTILKAADKTVCLHTGEFHGEAMQKKAKTKAVKNSKPKNPKKAKQKANLVENPKPKARKGRKPPKK